MRHFTIVFVVAACLAAPARPLAHEIPSDVRVQEFVAPRGDRLRLVVRAPLAAMGELDWPASGLLLDVARAEPVLRDAALQWIGGRIDVYEGNRPLGRPQLV